MRLLSSDSLQLFEFFDENIPQYVILSHTWGQDEITFQDIQNPEKAKRKKGFRKLEGCCKKAQSDGFQWIWIDTCCIDKSSSAELSEAINSMYQWYTKSQICYAFMEDVHSEKDFSRSRWFRRGWTLQELIAPSIVEFYTEGWVEIGTKMSLTEDISRITAIDESVLENNSQMVKFNIASRMSWASQRETTRIEDQAYCLMGLFGINMPLLYGEGRRAFHRLQEEIMKIHEDYTLFAWANPWGSMAGHCNPVKALNSYQCDGILAESPRDFSEKKWSKPWWPYSELYPSIKTAAHQNAKVKHSITGWEFMQLPTLTSQGLSIGLPLRRISMSRYQVCLTCTQSLANIHFLCLTLSISLADQQRLPGTLVCTIADAGQLEFIPQVKLKSNAFKYTPIYIAHTTSPCAILDTRNYLDNMIIHLNKKHCLKVQTDESCSMLESFVLGLDGCPHRPASNEFFLNCAYCLPGFQQGLPYEEGLRAVFKIDSQNSSPPFIIGFGTHSMRLNRAPWSDVLFQPRAKYDDDEVRLKAEGLQFPGPENTESSERTADVSRGPLKDLETGSRIFEVPLREALRDFGLSSSYSKSLRDLRDLFNAKSDRVVKCLPGTTVRVSVRRFGASEQNYQYILKVSIEHTAIPLVDPHSNQA